MTYSVPLPPVRSLRPGNRHRPRGRDHHPQALGPGTGFKRPYARFEIPLIVKTRRNVKVRHSLVIPIYIIRMRIDKFGMPNRRTTWITRVVSVRIKTPILKIFTKRFVNSARAARRHCYRTVAKISLKRGHLASSKVADFFIFEKLKYIVQTFRVKLSCSRHNID